MKKASLQSDYLTKYAVPLTWKVCAGQLDNIKQVVVIPAYAELEMLFATLASIAANPVSSLETTLVICVINNKPDASESVRENNSKTMKVMDALLKQHSVDSLNNNEVNRDYLRKIAETGIRLAYIDASSPGVEIPENVGGVGMARKIGMDMALRLFQDYGDEVRLILSLDADTLVQPDYLPKVRNVFSQRKIQTGILSYEHQTPLDAVGHNAICAYEIFLRYWEMGLKYAGSPYAFHSIGSTIVTTADAYLTVRGMNRREAGEDFYFLNKLAKISPVHTITDTIVYPSARISGRVPFGTGAAVEKITARQNQEYRLYDPRVFMILKLWLDCMKDCYSCSVLQILASAKSIHSGLENFLINRRFESVWPKIRSNIKDTKTYARQFHNWFDGFETLKLINYLTTEYYPKIEMITAFKDIMELQNVKFPFTTSDHHISMPDDQIKILEYMRRPGPLEPSSDRQTSG